MNLDKINSHNVQAFLHRLLLQSKRGDRMANETEVICKNIFKSSSEKESKEEFTKRWIELINQKEKNKGRTTASG